MARLDFGDWLATLPTQKRQVAEFLANGESTRDAAEQFGLTAGRISQIRKELEQSWNTFQSGMTLVNTA
jgi:DNA-binding NarL/FixJ family response regulator